jgi:hypothetical protein
MYSTRIFTAEWEKELLSRRYRQYHASSLISQWKIRRNISMCSPRISYAVPRRILELELGGPATVFVNEPLSMYTPLK